MIFAMGSQKAIPEVHNHLGACHIYSYPISAVGFTTGGSALSIQFDEVQLMHALCTV